MATMTRAATTLQYFARLVTHIHDEKKALAARTVQGFFLVVVAKKKAAKRSARLLASRRQASLLVTRYRLEIMLIQVVGRKDKKKRVLAARVDHSFSLMVAAFSRLLASRMEAWLRDEQSRSIAPKICAAIVVQVFYRGCVRDGIFEICRYGVEWPLWCRRLFTECQSERQSVTSTRSSRGAAKNR